MGGRPLPALHAGATLCLGLLLALAPPLRAQTAPSAEPSPGPSRKLSPGAGAALAGLPFLPNRGQADARVAWYRPHPEGTLFVTRRGELVHLLRRGGRAWSLVERPEPPSREALPAPRPPAPHIPPRVLEPAATPITLFVGSPMRGAGGPVAGARALDLGEPWPGVRLELRLRRGTAERLFRLAPGASAQAIRMRLEGARGLRATPDGALVAETGLGPVRLSPPVAWQPRPDGGKDPVAVRYRILAAGYGFALGPHDPARPVVIDPTVRATYLGGDGEDTLQALARAPDGTLYVAGTTASADFPGTAGGAVILQDGGDVFLARLSADLGTLLQATYYGGGGADEAAALALGPDGSVYLAGTTASTDLAGAAGGAQASCGGGCGSRSTDAFVARFSPDLLALRQATYLGGSLKERAAALAVGPGGVYLAGHTASQDLPVPGGAQTACGIPPGSLLPATPATSALPCADAFVARLSADLRTLQAATFYGGADAEEAAALALAADGTLYLAGGTASANLPAAGGAQTRKGGTGGVDAFVARLAAGLGAFLQATYFGGSGADEAHALALGPAGLYLAGRTASADLPGTAGAAQGACAAGCEADGFVALLSADLAALTRTTYLGGTGWEELRALAVAADGTVYAAGGTTSQDLPGTNGGLHATCAATCADVLVARLSGDLTALLQATYLGGSSRESLARGALALDGAGTVVLAGSTFSPDLPATAGALQPTAGAHREGWLALLPADLTGPQVRLALSGSAPATAQTRHRFRYTLQVAHQGGGTATGVRVVDHLPDRVRFVSALPSQGGCAWDSPWIRCLLGDLAPGAAATVEVEVEALEPGQAAHTAYLLADQSLEPGSTASASLGTTLEAARPGGVGSWGPWWAALLALTPALASTLAPGAGRGARRWRRTSS